MADGKVSIPSWIRDHKKWNQPAIGGALIPGISRIVGLTREQDIDEGGRGKASGRDRGKMVMRGLKITGFTIQNEIYTAEEERELDTLLPLLLPEQDPSQRDALSFSHPLTDKYGVKSVVVKKITPEHPKDGGPLLTRIELLVAKPAKEATSRTARSPAQQATSVPQIADPTGAKKAPRLQDLDSRNRVSKPSANVNPR